jgi:hypothetical protein
MFVLLVGRGVVLAAVHRRAAGWAREHPVVEEARDGLRELPAEGTALGIRRAREGHVSRSCAYNLIATFETEER